AAALRPHRRPAAHPGRDRPGLRRDPGADPADRVEDHVEAAAPVAVPGAARLPGLTASGTTTHPARPPRRAGCRRVGEIGGPGDRLGGGPFPSPTAVGSPQLAPGTP